MANVCRRRDAKGRPTGKWIAQWRDHAGRWRQRTVGTDKRAAEDVANRLESEAAQVAAGVIQIGDRVRREAASHPVEKHVEDYRLELIARENGEKHVKHTVGVLLRLLEDAGIESTIQILPDRIQGALGRLRAKRSARTANHARNAILGFVRWLSNSGRIGEIPPGLRELRRYNEATDRRRVRRALTAGELERLFAAAESGPEIEVARGPRSGRRVSGSLVFMTGRDRAALYRVAAITGLRANEIRTLTADCFRLDGDDPSIVVKAGYSKHRREDVQPIRRSDAEWLRAWFGQGNTLFVPEKTAKLLKADLERAGIPYRTDDGLVDFHALRATYITLLVNSGINPKLVQRLARHSTITLTLDRYTKVRSEDLRSALEDEPQ